MHYTFKVKTNRNNPNYRSLIKDVVCQKDQVRRHGIKMNITVCKPVTFQIVYKDPMGRVHRANSYQGLPVIFQLVEKTNKIPESVKVDNTLRRIQDKPIDYQRRVVQRMYDKSNNSKVLKTLSGWLDRHEKKEEKKKSSFKINYKLHPELYRIGKGTKGVFSVEPYHSELHDYFRYKKLGEAKDSVDLLLQKFRKYRRKKDFVGMDMVRKYLLLGHERTMEKKGKKKKKNPKNKEKRAISKLFKQGLNQVEKDRDYKKMFDDWRKRHG